MVGITFMVFITFMGDTEDSLRLGLILIIFFTIARCIFLAVVFDISSFLFSSLADQIS